MGVPNKAHNCRLLLAIILSGSLCTYLALELYAQHFNCILKARSDLALKPTLRNGNKPYFVDTEGCRMPSFEVMDENIREYVGREPKIECPKSLTRVEGNRIVANMNKTEVRDAFNITDVEEISCNYQEFSRKTDLENQFKEEVSFSLFEGVNLSADFVKVSCHAANNYSFYKDYYFSIPATSELPDRRDPDKVSAMIIGIDAVSRLNLLRQMNTTAILLRDKLNAAEFLGYNKVADNTYPNLVPVLSGLDEMQLKRACLTARRAIFDYCPLIWKSFKKLGFKTIFAEDVAELSLFNFYRKGFQKQPTDFYPRPIFLEMEKNIGSHPSTTVKLCLGGRKPSDVIFEYITKLIPSLQKEHFFSFFWAAAVTHDHFNMAQLIDEDFARLLTTLHYSNVLNHTVLFLMSDHGIRVGPFRKTYQGMMEERQPFLYAILPKWFSDKYSAASLNLRQNSNKLTTHFDLHETLSDLVDLSSITDEEIRRRSMKLLESQRSPRGISLFLPIPETRTCEDAAIASHWCTCHEQRTISMNDTRVQKAAWFVVKDINDKLRHYPRCHDLFLHSIMEAHLASSNPRISGAVPNQIFTDITIRFQTNPGLGEFEATVRMSASSMLLTGTVSRTNLYGNQSHCIDDYLLKLYCFCDS